MKSLVIFTLVFFSAIAVYAQEKTMDKFTVEINGLGCPYCASGIENEFDKLDAISDIKIDIKTGTLTFDYPTNANLNLEKVKAKVENAGYTLSTAKVERANGKIETLENTKEVKES